VVRDASLKGKLEMRAEADPGNAGHVGAPIPGAVTAISVDVGARVSRGDRLLVMEAMKMRSPSTRRWVGRSLRCSSTPATKSIRRTCRW